MVTRDIVVIGASAGGVDALIRMVGGLSADLAAALFVVLHLPATHPSVLPAILARTSALPAAHAVDGEAIRNGRIYVARPNHHLYVHRGHVRVAVGPRENGVRPAVDVLFRSASRAYRGRVVGVILSGALSDGAIGLAGIKMRDGTAVVQDPAEALFVGMPESALKATPVDYCVSVADIPAIVERLAHSAVDEGVALPMENQMDSEERNLAPTGLGPADEKLPGAASGLTCPDCAGSIWELRDGDTVRYECRVGHAYGPEAFLDQQGERVEAALWSAINTLEERAETFSRLAALYPATARFAGAYEERATEARRQAGVLRDLLYSLVQSGDVG